MDKSTEEYLAKIRKTIAESKQMVEMAKLRFAETDRMLAESGTSREEVMKMSFSEEQKEAVNAELQRRGFAPLEVSEEEFESEPMSALEEYLDPSTPESRRSVLAKELQDAGYDIQ